MISIFNIIFLMIIKYLFLYISQSSIHKKFKYAITFTNINKDIWST